MKALSQQKTLDLIGRLIAHVDSEIVTARRNGDEFTEGTARILFGHMLDTYAAVAGIETEIETL